MDDRGCARYALVAVAIALVACARNGVRARPAVQTEWERSVRICGSRLTDFMLSVCKTDPRQPQRTDQVPINLRRKRQIIEECCKISCTYGHLYENYCDHRGSEDTDTAEQVPSTTRPGDHAADGNATTATGAVESVPADAVVPTAASSWFERFLNGLKFW